jgi:hypothetical protein
MNCRDVRDVADSFLGEELVTETNHEILWHLDTCPSCRTEIDARRRLRAALRNAFNHAPELRPVGGFPDRLRDQLRQAPGHGHRSRTFFDRWFAVAAGVALAAGVITAILINRPPAADDTLARDAIGDHRNCALKYRLVRMPMPLEEAARHFDSAYRLLLTAPPDDVSTPNGPVHVVERHSCAYGARRFGHVILQYRGRVVSLLMTANGGATGPGARADVIPHVIGRPMDGLSVVSVNGSRHAVVLVSDLGNAEMTQLSQMVSLPLAQRLEGAIALSSGLAPVGRQRGFPIPLLEWTCLAILAGHANDAYARCA